MSKMKEEKFLAALDLWRLRTQERTAYTWRPKDEEAFQKIRTLIQRPGATEEFIEKWAKRLEEIQWCGEQPSVTFLMAYIYKIKEMFREIGVEIKGGTYELLS